MAAKKNSRHKLGLALSGGGFRASLFHIGVLARLAEMDLLRPVEVVSCVSGGSIIGAFYYLHLKRLLETKPDKAITREDYIQLVQKIETDFVAGVQKNVRVRAFSRFSKNWKMLQRSYSRSDRMAELYDAMFYDRVSGKKTMSLAELRIKPAGVPGTFSIRKDNAARRARVPMLILNATTLNTGRNWQFTAIDMGEREPDEDSESFDKNLVLSALRYDFTRPPGQALPQDKYHNVPLSVAVAASACVPGVFVPLPLTGLYPDVVPQLVDGGVQDNQGLASIIYEKCTDIIVSDASGQMGDVPEPGTFLLKVVTRSNSILMDRVRDQGLQSLFLGKRAAMISNHPIMHLREDVELERLASGDRRKKADGIFSGGTSYGILKEVQRRLSEVRTDLDSFSDVEAYSLMYSGYAMTGKLVGKELLNTYKVKSTATKGGGTKQPVWKFAAIKDYAEGRKSSTAFLKQLRVGREKLGKVYRLAPSAIPLGVLVVLVALAIPLLPVYFIWQLYYDLVPWWLAALSLIALLIPGGFGFVSLLAFLHLKLVDPVFLKKGKLKNI